MLRFDTEGLLEVHTRCLLHFGDPLWWPGDGPLEISIGAILTQNTNWSNVEKAIGFLKEEGAMDLLKLHRMDPGSVAKLIRPSGYYNQKARYLRSFAKMMIESFEGSFQSMPTVGTPYLREILLSVKGIGRETADSILCYALDRPVLVIDAYTRRILDRVLGNAVNIMFYRERPTYDELQRSMMSRMMGDTDLYNRFHALMVLLGKDHCRSKPVCSGCPLSDICLWASAGPVREGR